MLALTDVKLWNVIDKTSNKVANLGIALGVGIFGADGILHPIWRLPTTNQLGTAETATAYVSTAGNDSTALIGQTSRPFATVDAALLALNVSSPRPSLMTVRVGLGTFTGPNVDSMHAGIRLEGSGMPRLNTYTAPPTSLIGGTIFTSWPYPFEATGSQFERFGVDASSGGEGFVLTNVPTSHPTNIAPMPGVVVRDIIGLGSGPSALFHAVLLENLLNPEVYNVQGYNAVHGVVSKNTGGNFSHIQGGYSAWNAVIIKADNYAGTGGQNWNNVIAQNGGGILIDAATAPLSEINLSNLITRNTTYDLKLQGVQPLSNINIGAAQWHGTGVQMMGNVTNVRDLNLVLEKSRTSSRESTTPPTP